MRGKMGAPGFREGFGTVVLQPTSLCNLNCSYCYLPDRRQKSYIAQDVLERIAESLQRQQRPVVLLWHGGEPLAAGIDRFSQFLGPFRRLVASGLCQHSLQTNATLLNDRWCDLLREHHFRVGVSLDGDAAANKSRVYWNGRAAWSAATRGIEALRRNEIRFGIIAVVNSSNLDRAAAVYRAVSALGPVSISFNVEETEGLNVENPHVGDRDVFAFWESLFLAWRQRPEVPIRQFSDVIQTVQLLRAGAAPSFDQKRSFYPTVAVNGDVVLLSPELAAAPLAARRQFTVGNILDEPLEEIIRRGVEQPYVKEYLDGVEECRRKCSYFSFCGGGQASNKFFEHGRMDTSETRYCRNSKIAPAEVVIRHLEGELM